MRSSSVVRRLGLLLSLLVFAVVPLRAADLPPLTGRVVDAADLIAPEDEAALTQKLADFQARSSDQIVVATLPSLDGEAIEPFANRLFRAWGLGQAGEDNGVLLLVARDDRKMRIEVGYGLEGTLTDLHSRLIIENALVPAFRAGEFGQGIAKAVDDIITVLSGNAAELQSRYERNQAEEDEGVPIFVWIFVVLWLTLFLGGFLIAFLVPMFGRKIGPKRYRWLGTTFDFTPKPGSSGGGWTTSGGFSGGGGGRSSGGGFSGGGGSSGGGGASGSW